MFAAARDVTAQKQASQYARSLIEASLDPLVTISAEGKITDVNEACTKVTGVERQRLIGTDFSEYFTEPEKAREGYQRVFAEGSVVDYPLTIRRRDGVLTDVLYNASVYRDASGNVLGVFAAARDVTAQKQASQYARSLIEASLDPLVTISMEGKITDVNEACTKVAGVERQRLIGTDFSEYFTEPEKAREGSRRVFAEGSVVDYPLTIRRRDGVLTDVLCNASVYRDASGKVLGVFAAARDVTARKRAERLLQARERQQQAVAELGYLALSTPGFGALLDAAALAVARALDVEFAKVLELRSDGDLMLRAGIGFDEGLVGHAVVPGGTGSQAGYVLLAGEPVIVEDLSAETRFHPAALLTDHGARCGVSVAIGPRERPFGVIGAHTTATKRHFTRDDISFLAAVSNVIGTALQRAHAEDAARRQAEQHEAILATTSDGFWVYDQAARILDVNDAYCRMSGYTREELLRMRIADVEAILTEAQIVERMRGCTKSGFDRFETVHRAKDGHLFDVEISMTYSRKQDQFVLFARDVSDRKQAEREIRTLNTELEQRVTQRTEELRAANEELEAFVSSVSHDLRAPLRAMDGFSSVLSEGYAEQLDERGQQYLSRVRAGAQRMGTMIDELLRLSRVSRAELHRDQIDLSDLARQIEAELQAAEPERHVEFAIADGLTARADRELVGIVLENLLANAWKFTSTHEHARIEIGSSEHDGRTEFFVRDDGVGFDMEHAGQLFKAFQRLHRANEFPGTGIGLASVHRIIARHGGQISAQGEIGRGATFTFTLEPDGDAT